MRYYIDNSRGDIEAYTILSAITSIADKFSSKGHHVVENGEIKPLDVAAAIAPTPNGKTAMYAMMWGVKGHDSNEPVYEMHIEDVDKDPYFKHDWERHRCVIPVSYFSTDSIRGNKCSYFCYPKNDDIVWICGLYRNINGFPYFTILTMRSCARIRCFFDRIPLMITTDMMDEWVCPTGNRDLAVNKAVLDIQIERILT